MAKLLYSVTASLDGYVAGPGGDMSWLVPFLGPNPAADELVGTIGAVLVGRRSYDGDDPHRGTDGEGKPFGGGWDGPQFVLTHRPPARPVPGITFVGELTEAVALASAAAGAKDVNVIGPDVARQCLAAGLLDEVLVFVAPVLLGDGVRLFEQAGGTDVRLERLAVSEAPLATGLRYRVVR